MNKDLDNAKYLAFLGRQPEISIAEIGSLRPGNVLASSPEFSFLTTRPPVERMGGVIKLARIVASSKITNGSDLEDSLAEYICEYAGAMETSKLTLGISQYGINRSLRLNSSELKKRVKQQTEKSIRLIPSRSNQLSSAQILHNKLFKPNKIELNLVHYADRIYLAITEWVQDIEAYTKRDHGRPNRDAYVGMLPPKLAQILINLSTGGAPGIILDPFCGTGVLLQEAAIMGYSVIGRDIEPRMASYSSENLAWLASKQSSEIFYDVAIGDATDVDWPEFDYVACETYLGPPQSKKPTSSEAASLAGPVNDLHHRFFENLARQMHPGQRACVAVPNWQLDNGGRYSLGCLDSLTDLGYNRLDFAGTNSSSLIYSRPGQVVAREIILIEKK
ncbi:MAG: DNA methyltransferase [Patescibacteria group bacterium]